MKVLKRGKLQIYGDLLLIIREETTKEKIVISRIQLKTNMPFIRMKKNISRLKELGLIEDETSLKITEKGDQYIEEYEAILSFMRRMGLSYK
jgi:predicted transcriptional regulator